MLKEVLKVKSFALFALLLMLMGGCQQNAGGFTMQLQGEPGQTNWVYFSILGEKGYIDSVQLVDGKAQWSCENLSEHEVYTLEVKEMELIDYFVVEPGQLLVDLKEDAVSGTPLNDSISVITSGISTIMQSSGSYDLLTQLLENSLTYHKDDAVGSLIFYYLDMLAPREEIDALFAETGENLRQATITQKQMEAWDRLGGTIPGKEFTDFGVEYEGKMTYLSDFVGGENKATIVDFWASWCGPCKQEIPYLIDIYERYKDHGVMVVGVATWDKPEDTKRAIDQLKIPYPQIMNAQQIGSDAYGIRGIPEILIIDGKGIIRARGLREGNIEEALKQVLESESKSVITMVE